MRDPLEGVTDDGCIRTGVDRSRVPAAYEPVLAALVTALAVHRAGEPPPSSSSSSPPSSLLLYGSVATGQAQPPRSDVDAVLVGVPRPTAAALAADLSRRFADLCREVAVVASEVEGHQGDDDEAYGNRVFLRHHCVLLAGDDDTAGWPPFTADARAARRFNGDIAQRLSSWRDEVVAEPRLRAPHAAVLGRQVARMTLFAAAGLVSVHDGTWTIDRATGARRWGEVDPTVADDLQRLLAWADDGLLASAGALEGVLSAHGPVQRVADAFSDRVGLWEVR